MPVQHKKRRHTHRANPILGTGATSGNLSEVFAVTSDSNQLSIPALQKLKSEDAAERAWATITISHFVQDDTQRKQLFTAGLIPLLVPLLSDDNGKVVLGALGAMQNTVIAGGDSAAFDLIRANVMEPLLKCLGKISGLVHARLNGGSLDTDVLPPMDQDVEKSSTKGQLDDDSSPSPFDLAQQVFDLMWSLGEVSDDVATMLSEADLIGFSISLLDATHVSTVPWSLKKVVGQFLSMLTESNPTVHAIFSGNPSYAACLFAYVDGTIPELSTWDGNKIVLPVLCATILENIRSVLIDSTDTLRINEFYGHILSVLSKSLDLDIASTLSRIATSGAAIDLVVAKQTADQQKSVTEYMGDLNSVENKDTRYFKELTVQFETVQLVLELLANIYSEESNEGEQWVADAGQDDMDAEDANDTKDMDSDVDMNDMAQVAHGEDHAQGSSPKATSTSCSVLSNALFSDSFQLIPKLVRIVSLPLHSQKETSQSAAPIMAHIRTILARSLGCLTNMILLGYLTEWTTSQPALVSDLFHGVFRLCLSVSSSTHVDMDLLDSCIGVQWALLSQLAGHTPTIVPTMEYIDWLLRSVSAPSGAPASLRAKGVGVLASFARMQGSIEINRTIGRAFIAQLATSDTPEVLCEILNGIYDIYGDAAYDYDQPVFVQGEFLGQLQKLYPILRAQFKKVDKRRQRDVRDRADEMILNLHAFIQYKGSEKK
ncbi:hypothetical protein BASA62_002216 [Batrachochytrium salamandrivorans]|nr:hypothetical protein BASA62_002216 [Batrachochytrium salamandrivorans]